MDIGLIRVIAIIIDALTQPRNPIEETYSWIETTSDEGVYEELDDIRMAMLPTQVAITNERKQSRPRPPTKPRPKARPSTIQPRGTLERARSLDTMLQGGRSPARMQHMIIYILSNPAVCMHDYKLQGSSVAAG